MKTFIRRIKPYVPAIALVFILLVAGYLRLYKIDQYMTFLGDEGRDVLVVKRMIVDHKFTLLGPTASVGGFFLGPIYYYFMLPFLWAWSLNPVGPAVMVGLFGVATVYLVYLTGRAMFGSIAGLVAASLYAVSPLVIAYSRSSWNPNVVPFFSTLLLYLLFIRAKPFWIGLVLGIGVQLHYLFLFLYVVVGIWYFIHRKRVILRDIGYGCTGLLVGLSPFLAFELRHGFTNTRYILQFIFAGKETGIGGNYFMIIADVLFRVFGRLLFRYPQPDVINDLPLAYVWSLRIFTTVTMIISVIKLRVKPLVFLWLSIVIVLFGFYNKSIYDYYFGIMFAIPFLAIGFLGYEIYKKKTYRWVVFCLWGALLVFNWQGRPFIHAPNNQLAQVRTIAKTAYDQTGGKPFNFALITGGNSDHAYRYFFEIWGNPPVVIENTDNDPDRKSVTDQLIIICEDTGCKPLGNPLWEVAGFGRAEIVGTWEVPFVKIFKLTHYEGE